jgi:DHA1 family bicyclomycin/chloramphenicol resistance-like MFS transporter
VNSLLLRRFKSEEIIKAAIICQFALSIIFVTGVGNGWFGLGGSIAMLFLVLCCIGLCNPNTSALSMSPFPQSAGVASALLGTLQLGLGALSSFAVGWFNSRSAIPLAAIIAVTSALSLVVLLVGRRSVGKVVEGAEGGFVGH